MAPSLDRRPPVDDKTAAQSLLEFLAEENPPIELQEPRSRSNTPGKGYFVPKKVKRWDEFSYTTLEAIYDGVLMEQANQKRTSLPSYPDISLEFDCDVENEPNTTHIYTKWNHTIVVRALNEVRESLHPSIWVSKARTRGTKTKSGRRFVPDAGARSACQANKCALRHMEMLPKDYKVASKWKSSVISDQVNEMGEWEPTGSKKNDVLPLRQAYTYCVYAGCRYGCILTTDEAFIFRIKPCKRAESLDSSTKALKGSLSKDGLMEFVSIPWSAHGEGRDDQNQKAMTVNLALWLIHVLAGNHHNVDWDYPSLLKEGLRTKSCMTASSPLNTVRKLSGSSVGVSESPLLDQPSQKPGFISRKRRADTVAEDDPMLHSFAESQGMPSYQMTSFESSFGEDRPRKQPHRSAKKGKERV